MHTQFHSPYMLTPLADREWPWEQIAHFFFCILGCGLGRMARLVWYYMSTSGLSASKQSVAVLKRNKRKYFDRVCVHVCLFGSMERTSASVVRQCTRDGFIDIVNMVLLKPYTGFRLNERVLKIIQIICCYKNSYSLLLLGSLQYHNIINLW